MNLPSFQANQRPGSAHTQGQGRPVEGEQMCSRRDVVRSQLMFRLTHRSRCSTAQRGSANASRRSDWTRSSSARSRAFVGGVDPSRAFPASPSALMRSASLLPDRGDLRTCPRNPADPARKGESLRTVSVIRIPSCPPASLFSLGDRDSSPRNAGFRGPNA